MDIEKNLLAAIEKNEIVQFLRGDGEYMIEPYECSPAAELTDVGRVLSKGVYKVYTYKKEIRKMFEESLLIMLDNSDFDIYMVCLYILDQLFNEKYGSSPFILSKDLIITKLTRSIDKRQNTIKGGIKYPNGYMNTFAMTEIERFRKVCKEEYMIIF